jgi:hypothetical protein
MVRTNHCSLPTAALLGGSPPPYPFVTGDLYFLPKIWSKSVVLGTDPFEDALKRPSNTIPPSITTTHHDGGLPSPLSYTLADDDPPLPSTLPKRSRRNLRERNIFRNNGWTKRRQCSLQTNWKRHDLRRRLIGSAGRKPKSGGKPWICRSTGHFCLSGISYLRRPFGTRINV